MTTVVVNRSTDGGLTLGDPRTIPPPAAKAVDLDKNWTVCDNHPASPFYGNCYTELDNFGDGDIELMSTSTDGGLTWCDADRDGRPRQGTRRPAGRAAERPRDRAVREPQGHDRGLLLERRRGSWATPSRSRASASTAWRATCAPVRCRARRSTSDGTVFVAWEDCRFRAKCSSNDIVFSMSADGATWSDPARVPIDPVDEHGRPLHPRPRGRSCDQRFKHPPRADVLLLPRRQLRRRVSAERRLRVVARCRRALGRRDSARRADGAE